MTGATGGSPLNREGEVGPEAVLGAFGSGEGRGRSSSGIPVAEWRRQEAGRLRSEGLGFREIARRLGVSVHVARRCWFQGEARLLIDGGKRGGCASCGVRPDDLRKLHWHHIDPSTRSFMISQWRRSVRCSPAGLLVLKAELAKCEPLCPKCHVAAHRRLRALVANNTSVISFRS
jgi:hypothetical protein